MAGSNISYLDLANPDSDEVRCFADWPLRSHAVSFADPKDMWRWWVRTDLDRHSGICEVPGAARGQCRAAMAPVDSMKRPLALARGDDVGTRYDILGMWARFFLVITFLIWIGMIAHDLALIGPVEKDFILDVTGVNNHCPVIRRVWRCLAGFRLLARLMSHKRFGFRVFGIAVAMMMAPILIVWNVVVFNFVIVPLLLLAFLRYPVRMSRAWVFIVCLACAIYGLALAAQQLAYAASPGHRPRYAVTWEVPTVGGNRCVCGCDYPISFNVCMNLTVVGVGTTVKSLFVAFRCLKGLRRSQWANLLSVIFPVPITIYSVEWRQGNGHPIRHRTDGQAVQEEVAFDPFAMMDEQPDSAFTTVHLRPEPLHVYTRASGGELTLKPSRNLETPSKPLPTLGNMMVRETEYIGCCGFPWPTGGTQAVYDPTYIVQLDRVSAAAATNARGLTAETLGRQLDSNGHDDAAKVNGTDAGSEGNSLEDILLLVGNGGGVGSGDCCLSTGESAPQKFQHPLQLQQQKQHGWPTTTGTKDAPPCTGHNKGGSSSSTAAAWEERGRCSRREPCSSAGREPVQKPRDHTPEPEDTQTAYSDLRGRRHCLRPTSPQRPPATSASKRPPTAKGAATQPAMPSLPQPPRRRPTAGVVVEPFCTAGGYHFGANMAQLGSRSWQIGSCLSICTVGCPQPARRNWAEQFDTD